MSDYSISPLDVLVANQAKGYIGLHVEQAVPLLDRDLNLLQDLIYATVRSVFTRYIGNGIPEGLDGFAIQASATSQDFVIKAAAAGPGNYMAGGIEVTIPVDTDYISQNPTVLTTPAAARTDIVYLDIFFSEVDGTVDTDLNNSADVGMETSVRVKPGWIVRVAEGVPMPGAPAGHVYTPLAQLGRAAGNNAITAGMITDLRQSRITVSTIQQRLALMEQLLLLPSFASTPVFPASGAAGAQVDLQGRNLNLGTPQVFFGAVPAVSVGATTPTDVKVTVPNLAAGNYSVSIITAGGGPVTASHLFTVVGAPPPPPPTAPTLAAVNPILPLSGNVNASVTIAGTNFDQPGLAVSFNLTAAKVVSSSATQISITVPNVPLGGYTITVTTNAGSVAGPTQFTVV
jgi:hypothetical protein